MKRKLLMISSVMKIMQQFLMYGKGLCKGVDTALG